VTVAVPYPTLRLERRLWESGARVVCGIDEVGRGSWAGPVTVAAVVPAAEHLRGVRDSKLLAPEERERAAPRIRAWAVGVGVGHASHTECDDLGMTEALRRAALRALDALARQGLEPDQIVLDGTFDYLRDRRVQTVVKGDTKILSVAAASVVAKVARDDLMAEEAEHFPAYGFESNRGYPAPAHRSALAAYGPCIIHRRSWVFMESLPWCGLHRATPPRLFAV
jgi:ribonuclease HII